MSQSEDAPATQQNDVRGLRGRGRVGAGVQRYHEAGLQLSRPCVHLFFRGGGICLEKRAGGVGRCRHVQYVGSLKEATVQKIDAAAAAAAGRGKSCQKEQEVGGEEEEGQACFAADVKKELGICLETSERACISLPGKLSWPTDHARGFLSLSFSRDLLKGTDATESESRSVVFLLFFPRLKELVNAAPAPYETIE